VTAEVAVLNKLAVALAADSAVTIGQGKIYNSANKLFALSKYAPVAIMVYGNAEFMYTPWETLVKNYRKKLHRETFAKVQDYANDFLDFLRTSEIVPQGVEDDYICAVVSGYLNHIKNDINQKVEKHFEENKELSEKEALSIIDQTITSHTSQWDEAKLLPDFGKGFNQTFLRRRTKKINALIDQTFEALKLSANSKKNLLNISAKIFSKNIFSNGVSGIVIAGFGDADDFPSVLSYRIECKIEGKIKYEIDGTKSSMVSHENHSVIIPFAQSEMVATFMEGMDPDLQNQSEQLLDSIFDTVPKAIAEAVSANESDKEALESTLSTLFAKIYEKYKSSFREHRTRNYVSQILSMVAVLPKDELAAMAESLVNLTSFKRRVTGVPETVGGPVDVVVISKGDGLVWIKRKHYFPPELNHHFFKNYYLGALNEIEK
jgi:hypothetical protein